MSLTGNGVLYTQTFDTLSNTAGSSTNTALPTGWYLTEQGGGARDNEQYGVDTGSSTTGDIYSYGAAGSTDRALGQLRSGTLIPFFGAKFTNNTGATITSLAITYTGEEWRLGTAGRTDQMNFELSTNATDLSTGTYTAIPSLAFVTPDTATTGAKNGNAAADRTTLTFTISGLSVANGASFFIRWTDVDASGADDGLAIDDFNLTPSTAAADTTPPTADSMTVPANGTYRNGQTLDFIVNFSETVLVTGQPRLAITLNSGTVYANYFSGSNSSALTFRYTVGGSDLDPDGIAMPSSVDLNGGSIKDTAGNALTNTLNGVPSTAGILIDGVLPVVSSISRVNATPTNASSVDFTVTFSENVTGVDATDFAITASGVTGASVTNVAGSGTTYTVTVGTGSGSGTIRLDVSDDDSIADAAGNKLGGTGAGNGSFTTGQSYAIDRTAPTVQTITRANANPTNATTVDFTVAFSETVTGVDTGDFSLTTTGVSGASITGISGTGPYVVTVNTGTGDGTIRLDLVANNSIADAVGNPLTASFTSGEVYSVQKSIPAVTSITRVSANPTNAAAVDYTVTFSQTVTGVDATDFTITSTGLTGASVTNVAGSGTSYTVTVNTGSGDGTLRLDVTDNDSIQSAGGAPLGGSGAGNGSFTSGESYTVDKTAPSVQSIIRASANPTKAASVDFTVAFSESVTGVDATDFSLTTTGVSGASVTGVSGSGAAYIVTVNTGTGDGTIRLDVASNGSILDAAGNTTTSAFTTGPVYAVDKTAPTVQSVTRVSTNPTTAATADYTVTFAEAVTGVDAGDFAITANNVSGASVANVSGSGTTYTVTVNTGNGNGTIRLDVSANGTIVDVAGNALAAAFTSGDTYTVNKAPAAPTGLVATPGNHTVGLTWNAVPGASGYNVKRSTSNGGPYTTIAPNLGGTAYGDNAVSNGTAYYYVVSALNAFGESLDSTQVTATPVLPANQIGVVISQVYGGGGSAYSNDYIELFNTTTSDVNIGGYALQYGSAAGNFGSVSTNIYTIPANTTIPAGRYLSIKFGAAGNGLPTTTDIDGGATLSLSGSSGKVALTINNTALGCGTTPCTLPDSRIVDLVAYGAANNGEGGTSVNNGAAMSASAGGLRKNAGCTDTNNNNADFDVATTATGLAPRTLATAPHSCPTPNYPPVIFAPANPAATVNENAATFPVTINASDDNNVYSWSATPGTGVASVSVASGQGSNSVTYNVTLQTNYYGTATFTASVSDTVNPAVTQTVNIAVNRDVTINHPPTITAPADPITFVAANSAPINVNISGNDDYGLYTWSATPGTGVTGVTINSGQGSPTVTYNVSFQPGFTGIAAFTATLSDGVNPAVSRVVHIGVSPNGSSVNHVVISQIYGGGGNTGATYSNDYVELYNPTGTAVDMTGWTLQYGSAANTGPANAMAPLGGIIGPGEYFLVALASGANGAALPAPNLSGDINMSGTNGKIALVRNGDLISGTCGTLLSDPDIIDFVGYGSANCSEGGSTAPAPANSATALFRASGGDVDTNVNGSDFSQGAPNPRRTSPIQEIGPVVVTVDPSNNDSIAPRDANLVITFSEPVDITDPNWFTITCTVTGAHNSATYAQSGTRSWTIVPNVNFQAGEQCTATVLAAYVRDSDTDDANPNTDYLPSNYSWSFTVASGTAPPYPSSVHLTMGNPSGAVADTNVPNNYLMEKPEMSLSYNRDKGEPNWVSWHLADEWVGSLPRNDTFRADPAVPPTWYRVLGSDYSGSGFDRGHMMPNADRDKETSVPINQATFLMSNMIPQAPDNNQGPWAAMEGDLRTIVAGGNELYIVSGPAGSGGTGSNGPATTIDNGHVAVPAYTWKVVMVLPKASGDDVARVTAATRTIAVIMPNVQGIRNNDWHQYITTVDAVEALTGYDFFSNVPDAIENAIEAGTDGTNPPGAANGTATTSEDTAKAITLDAATPGGSLTYTITSTPAHGQLTGTGANQTYTPAPDFHGTDSFSYKVNDGTRDSNTATVTITVSEVNDNPVATADAKTATANTPLTFAASDLTANDNAGATDESTQTLTVTQVAVTGSTHGTVSLTSGSITYTPDTNYSGAASFSYTVCDNGTTNGVADPRCSAGTVNVTVNPAVASTIAATAGTPQTATVGTQFATALKAKVTDAQNVGLPNISVTFTAPATGASGTFASSATVLTDANGIATAPAFTANGVAGSYNVTATTGSLSATFALTNLAGPATHFSVTGPGTATANTPFSLTVTALDASNNTATAYAGTIHFTSTLAGTLPSDYTFVAADKGTHTFSATITAPGQATITATDTVTSSITGAAIVNVNPATAASISSFAGTPQSAQVSTQFATPMQAKVVDANNAPVSGISVTFSAPSSGASGTFASSATVMTDANGIATAPAFTANGIAGSYSVTATTGALSTTFALTNTAAPATHYSVTAPANATAGVPFNVTVTALDAANQTVTGYAGTVHFSSNTAATLPSNYTFVAGDHGTHTFSVTVTNAGPATITATDTVTSSITGNAGVSVGAAPPAAMSSVAGTPQSAQVNTQFATAMRAKVVDANNNALAGISVTFSAPSTGASGTFAGSATVTTDVNGIATAPAFTANNVAGSYSVTATAGALSTTFALTNTPPPATHFSVTAPSTAAPGTPFNVTVTALDATNNVVPGYRGSIHFTSNANGATLPPDYTFLAGDNGTHTFSAAVPSPGSVTITATDKSAPSINGATTVNVACAPSNGSQPLPNLAPVCANSTGNVASVANTANTTYAWSVTNGTITSGQGTSTITYTAGATGNVTINLATSNATSGCGTQNYSGTVAIRPRPEVSVPALVTGCANGTTSIPVVLTGTAPFTIVWSDGVTQSGIATSSTTREVSTGLTRVLSIVSMTDASCAGSVTGGDITIITEQAPQLQSQTTELKIKGGETAHLSLYATGPELLYEWFQGKVGDVSKPIANNNFPDYMTPPLRESTDYWVRISNPCGSVNTQQMSVRVIAQDNNGNPRRRPSGH